TGPRASYLAYASNISNFTGLTSLWANAGMLSDHATAAHGALAVLAALRVVGATGAANHLDMCQIEVMAALLAPVLLDPLVNGREPRRLENDVPWSLVSGVFQSRGDDRWVAVEADDVDDWNALAGVVGRTDLQRSTPDETAAARAELEAAVAAWSAERSNHSAATILQRAGVAAGAVQTDEDVVRDPQLRHRRFPVALPHPD